MSAEALDKYLPWKPTPYDKADACAIRALQAGEATPEQQQRALRWIIEDAARAYQPTFFPDSARDSDFAQGRRYVGLQLVTILNLPHQLLEKL